MFHPHLISIRTDPGDRTGFVSRIAQPLASEVGSVAKVTAGGHSSGESSKNIDTRPRNLYFSVKRP
jgi:hypothetical protein